VVIVAALVVGAVIISSKPAETRTSAPSQTKTAEKVAGPLDGTYRVEYGPDTKFSGSPHHDASPAYAPAVEEWAIRSTCPNTGCVATAARESSNAVPHDLSTPIFDEVSGRWVAVGVEPAGSCNGRSSEVWTAMTLQGQTDGTLSGELTYTSPLVCGGKRTVVFTRTGDVTANDVADPATEAPRVASPAQPLYGQYRWVQTFSDGGVAPVEYHYAVSTECVRTGERCLSYLFSASSDVGDALSFANDAWTKNISHDEPCPSGNGDSHSVDTAEFPLPQPLQNPITLLVGHGHHDNGGGCSFATDFDVRLERTGD
jgi:serine/threonine-protein kinase